MQVQSVGPALLPQPAGGKQEAGGSSFSEMLQDALKKVNDAQVKADNLARQLLTGEVQDIHQVTVAMQEARLTMQLAVEVRNKIIEAYQEISRMQV
ncbi:MAG: flagellar hook-basal body complex protein FliE [Pelotomaculum sp.]|nr:flagellar hook-basal body complex protein FliE [Pelotomaculum sp.]